MLIVMGFIAVAIALVMLALRFRQAIRGVWQANEALKAQLKETQLRQTDQYRQLYGELAGLVSGRTEPVPFHAQHGEDIFLWDYFGRKQDGYFIEIGAHDGVSLSNTYAFERIGWSGLLVEANPDVAELCRKNRPGSRVVHAAVGAPGGDDSVVFHAVSGDEGDEMLSFVNPDDADLERCRRDGKSIRRVEVPFRTMDSILEEESPAAIDFVTIDVEGGELDVLKGFDLERYFPSVIVLENNTGSRENDANRYMNEHGYRCFHTMECNEFYKKQEDNEHE